MAHQTDRYVVFGNPVAHSLSPRIHGLFSAQTGQNMDYGTVLAPLDGFAAAVRTFAHAGGRGANVTVPFKEEAFRLVAESTLRAQAAGAVNTLSFTDAVICGDNTDGAGLVRDLRNNLGLDLAGKRLLLLGAGGAARGVVAPLLEERPAELFIANRTVQKAVELAAIFQVDGGGYGALAGRRFDLLINATAAGLSDATLPLPTALFSPDCFAYEMLYGRKTPFMVQAHTAGCRVADGLGMLVEQAAEAFCFWHGMHPQTAPVLAAMRA